MLRKIKNLLYGTFLRGMMNALLFLCIGSFLAGLILSLTLSPVAIVLCFMPFAMLVMMHLAFMPRQFDTWTLFPIGLKISNKTIRAMYWAKSAEDLDKMMEEYIIKYK